MFNLADTASTSFPVLQAVKWPHVAATTALLIKGNRPLRLGSVQTGSVYKLLEKFCNFATWNVSWWGKNRQVKVHPVLPISPALIRSLSQTWMGQSNFSVQTIWSRPERHLVCFVPAFKHVLEVHQQAVKMALQTWLNFFLKCHFWEEELIRRLSHYSEIVEVEIVFPCLENFHCKTPDIFLGMKTIQASKINA